MLNDCRPPCFMRVCEVSCYGVVLYKEENRPPAIIQTERSLLMNIHWGRVGLLSVILFAVELCAVAFL